MELTGQVSSLGVPKTWKMRESWSRSDSPGKNGTRNSSSANIQPIAHMSTPVPYCLAPNNNSGDLKILISLFSLPILTRKK